MRQDIRIANLTIQNGKYGIYLDYCATKYDTSIFNVTLSNSHTGLISGTGGKKVNIVAENNERGLHGDGPFIHCVVRNNKNTGFSSGGEYSAGKISNCLVYNNGIGVSQSTGTFNAPRTLTVINSVISGNETGLNSTGEGVVVEVKNSIIWNNTIAARASCKGDDPTSGYGPQQNPSYIKFEYCNVQGISEGISTCPSDNLRDIGNCIDTDPIFQDADSYNFHLGPNSPCINSGHLDASYQDVDGSRNDMGIYGGPQGNWDDL